MVLPRDDYRCYGRQMGTILRIIMRVFVGSRCHPERQCLPREKVVRLRSELGAHSDQSEAICRRNLYGKHVPDARAPQSSTNCSAITASEQAWDACCVPGSKK
jgi:hypothetical protein